MPKRGNRVALYLRVSTGEQSTDNQKRELLQVAEARGWQVVGIFEDKGISGAKGREHRKQFDALLKEAARGKLDVVAAWSVDRLGRSLQDLVGFLGEVHALDIDLYLHQQGVDTTTPAGRAMFQMLGVFAEFERSIIQERIRAGIARAKESGTKSGAPIGRPHISRDTEKAIRSLRAKGMGMSAIQRKLGVGGSTVHRILSTQRSKG